MNLFEIRTALVTAFAAGLPEVKVEPHGGRFDIAELDAYAIAAPEIRVAILGAKRASRGRSAWDISFAAYVIAGRDRQMLASERGLAIASAAMAFLARHTVDDSTPPDSIAYQNLYSAESRERNKHLSAITWTQTVEMTDAAAASLNDFLLFAATYDLAPVGGTVLAEDAVELPPPEAP